MKLKSTSLGRRGTRPGCGSCTGSGHASALTRALRSGSIAPNGKVGNLIGLFQRSCFVGRRRARRMAGMRRRSLRWSLRCPARVATRRYAAFGLKRPCSVRLASYGPGASPAREPAPIYEYRRHPNEAWRGIRMRRSTVHRSAVAGCRRGTNDGGRQRWRGHCRCDHHGIPHIRIGGGRGQDIATAGGGRCSHRSRRWSSHYRNHRRWRHRSPTARVRDVIASAARASRPTVVATRTDHHG